MDIAKTVIECVARVYKKSPEEIGPETIIREELSDKSMLMVALVSSIENELDVMIPIGQTTQLHTVSDFIARVKEEIG